MGILNGYPDRSPDRGPDEGPDGGPDGGPNEYLAWVLTMGPRSFKGGHNGGSYRGLKRDLDGGLGLTWEVAGV